MAWLCRSRTALKVLCAGLVAGALAAPERVSAHPHVWVKVETTVVFDNGAVTGLRQRWTFDEFYTLMAIQGLDTNNDGVYSREELAELAKVNMEALKQFDFYTHARLGEQKLALAPAAEAWLEHGKARRPAGMPSAAPPADAAPAPPVPKSEPKPGFFGQLGEKLFGKGKPGTDEEQVDMLSLVFTLKFAQPVLPEAAGFTFAVYDPEFFIAFDLAEGAPIKLGEGAPPGCRIEMAEAPEAERLGEAFTQQFGTPAGFGASKPAKLQCGPRS